MLRARIIWIFLTIVFTCLQNHCCAPSMYTKVLDIDGRPRLVFFARFDIRPGQELTYDYRFKVKH